MWIYAPFILLPHSAESKDLTYIKGIKGWAKDWLYIHQRASQPANQPAYLELGL